MTTTAPDRQLSTPAQAPDLVVLADDLEEAKDNIHHPDAIYDPWALRAFRIAEELLDEVRRLRGELDAAPTVYALPAEPPVPVTELCSNHGTHWRRHPTRRGYWVGPQGGTMSWRGLLLATEWLSTVPPERTEAGGDDA